jgi:hypothetical protein
MAEKENKLILYKDEEGKLSVNTLFADEDVWLTQAQLVEIYQSSKSNISEHLTNIFSDKELDKEVVVRKFRTTTPHGAIEGKTQTHGVLHYNEHTAAELIYERVDNEKPFVGMTNFKGNYVTRDDVKITKNYLTERELQRLNLLTSQFLDYAEFQALEQNPMRMVDWIAALDDQILRLRKNILEGNGTVSHQEAIEKAEKEFEIYREREMRLLESDFDKAVKRLRENNENHPDDNK